MRPCNCRRAGCRQCWLIDHRPEYAKAFGEPLPEKELPLENEIRSPCAHEGQILQLCMKNDESLHVRDCEKLDIECTRGRSKVQSCASCTHYIPERKPMIWSYGVTTIPNRWDTLLPTTLKSLQQAGFDKPRLFVDGLVDKPETYGLPVTQRGDRIRTYGNWVLGLAELYLRDPGADRYAMFQDDLLTYRNLRQYLESVEMRERCYWNLLTFPVNHALCEGKKGFFLSNQRGKGAVGLVFSREAVKVLLGHQHMIDRVEDRTKHKKTQWERGWESVDGGVVSALAKAGYVEMCHNPSLVTHIGHKSSMDHPQYPPPPAWRGEEFDALDLLEA